MEYTEIIACRNRKCKYHLSNDKDFPFEKEYCPDLCTLASIIMDEDGKCHDMEEKR